MRLSTLDDPIWDNDHVFQIANPLLILDCISNNMEQVANVAGLDNSDAPNGDIFSRSVQIFRSFRSEFVSKLAPESIELSNIPNTHSINDIQLPDAGGEELFDNDWFLELLTPIL